MASCQPAGFLASSIRTVCGPTVTVAIPAGHLADGAHRATAAAGVGAHRDRGGHGLRGVAPVGTARQA